MILVDEPEVAEFIRKVQLFESVYKSIRARVLFADRGKGLAPVITRISLLTKQLEESESILWESRSLKVVEQTTAYTSIDSLLSSIILGNLTINSKYIGFYENEEPNWYYNIDFRGENRENSTTDSTTLSLNAYISIKDSPRGYEHPFVTQMKSNPTLPVSSIKDLTLKLLGQEYEEIGMKRVEIIAPTFSKIESLEFRENDIRIMAQCPQEVFSRFRFSAVFNLVDGGIQTIERRVGLLPFSNNPDKSITFVKTFHFSNLRDNALGANITLSLGGQSGIAIDTKYCQNQTVVNPIWTILSNLDETRAGKFFVTDTLEDKLSNLNQDAVFESLMSSLLTSCGFRVAWIGGFGLSAQDMLAFDLHSGIVLICECTVGSPHRKIGLMKNALSRLISKTHGLLSFGIVFTTALVSDQERQGALQDKVILRDSADLKELTRMASNAPEPKQVYLWLGVDNAQ